MASLKVTVGQITDKGLNPRREANEDSLLVMLKRGLFLVADGVGGRRGGKLASQTVTEVFTKVFGQEHTDDLSDLIVSTIDLCNQKIFEEAETNPEHRGMATTLALLAIEGTRAVIAHVGDSRVYRYDRHGLICLTEDHSEVSEALRAGVITEEQAAAHPRRNIINRALGAEISVEPDIVEVGIDSQTSFILCSDGITRHVTDQEIARLMKSGRHPQSICESLKELCYTGGAEDNLTVIVVDLGNRQYAEEPTKPTAKASTSKVAPGVSVTSQRSGRRIEVDLSGAQSVGEQSTGSLQPGSKHLGKDGAGAPDDSRSGDVLSRSQDRRPPETGELSRAMKWSLLIVALVGGVIIGALLAGPITAFYDRSFGEGQIYVKHGIDSPPSDPEVRSAYGVFLEGRHQEARAQINRVLTTKPNHAEATFYLGRMDYAEDKYDEAIKHLTQAVKLDPTLPDIRIHLAIAYLSIGQQRNAKDVLQPIVAPPFPPPGTTPSPSPTSSPEKARPVG